MSKRSVQYVEVDVPHCSLTYGVAPCQAVLGYGSSALESYDLDGANDYLTRGAALTGGTTTKLLTFSFWIKQRTATNGRVLAGVSSIGGSTARSRISYGASGASLDIHGHNAAGTSILQVNVTPPALGVWSHVLGSVDLANSSNRHVYVNDAVQSPTWTTYTNDSMDFGASAADWGVGAYPNGGSKLDAELFDLWYAPGVYIDFSVEANRRLFSRVVGSHYTAKDLGATGDGPTGAAPLVFFSGAFSNWHTNKGTGGGFTVHGTPEAGTYATGLKKCFNTPATCQDRENYDESPVTMRFGIDSGIRHADVEAIPLLGGVNFTPPVIAPGENMGQRATMSAVFKDGKHSDAGPGFDKYWAERGYDPHERGSFWGKFKARNQYLRGRAMRWIIGHVDQSLAQMETRHFVIESFDGPSVRGEFTIVAKDVLKFLDGDRAQAPVANLGYLVGDITETSHMLVLSPSGVGNLDYPTSGLGNIGGKELVSFLRPSSGGLDAFTKLLLHCDGDNASTTFTDSSGLSHTVNVSGNAALSTAQKKFGSASLHCDGNGDYIDLNGHADFAFGTGDFTVEFWFMADNLGQMSLYDGRPSATSGAYPAVSLNASNQLQYIVTNTVRITGGTAISADTWYHFALTRSGTSTRMFLNGTQEGSTWTDSTNYLNPTARPRIGSRGDANSNHFDGWIDEIRITKGSAVWTSNFTPRSTPYDDNGGDAVYITRAQQNTEASSHSAQDRFQVCLVYDGEDVADILYDLIVNFGGLDSSYVPLASWQSESANYLGVVYGTIIANPTPVKTLVSELIEQAALVMWYDDVRQLIQMNVLRGVPSVVTFDSGNVIENTLQISEQPERRKSQVWTYYGMINPLTSLTDEANFRSVLTTVDLQKETDHGSPMIKKIYSRWIDQAGIVPAGRVNDIILSRFRDPPSLVKFRLMRYSVDTPELGGSYNVSHPILQDDEGTETPIQIQITSLRPGPAVFEVTGEQVLYSPTEIGDRLMTFNSNINNVNLRETHDNIYPAPQSGDVVIAIVSAGVIVGSESTALPAMNVGDWPAGVTVEIIVEDGGRIQGAGGAGGKGGNNFTAGDEDGQDGFPGGTALYTRFAITLTLPSATGSEVWGGGGGGGGGGVRYTAGSDYTGGGGSGGAGSYPGAGGPKGSSGGYPDVFRGKDGAAGTTEAGGISPSFTGAEGGNGGGPGQSGASGVDGWAGGGQPNSGDGGAGGAAGAAVDGHSYVTYSGTGDIRGGQIN